ncbi:hypothetical protein [uncultured Pelagimonas sp.]|uniref:hypothetical protein n=1 Tax=uncultured Pelagimonas sp. TaxID=1618102 RepID=UPI00262974A1|nr:hypothetical protein [uncultured Pelagimonas sp.]
MLLGSLILASGGALACSPAPNDQAKTELGAACSVMHVKAPFGREGLSGAENLWLGYAAQVHSVGDGCFVTETQILLDCAKDEAVLFGPGQPLSTTDHQAAIAGAYGEVVKWARTDPVDLDTTYDKAVSAGLWVERLETLSKPVHPAQSEHPVDLTCACRLFYPETKGAGA